MGGAGEPLKWDREPDEDSGGVETQHQAREGSDAGSNPREGRRAYNASCSRGRRRRKDHRYYMRITRKPTKACLPSTRSSE